MSANRNADYLESKILTASGPRLHLMLIEGAIRFLRKAEQDFAANNEAEANQAVVRALDIVAEMLAGVRHSDAEINVKLAQLYNFLFRTLTSVYVNADVAKLRDVLRILEYQRETWQLACERMAVDTGHTSGPAPPHARPPMPNLSTGPATDGLSIQA